MIGLDTNVLVRYLVRDDAAQAARAERELERDERFLIDGIVLCELVWVLESAYGRPRAVIVAALEQIVRTGAFTIEHADHVRSAVAVYKTTSADFADALVGRIDEAAGCEHTVTFDRGLKRLSQFRVL